MHSYVWHDSFVYLPWLICNWVVTHLYVTRLLPLTSAWISAWWLSHVWHYSFVYAIICVTWLIHICNHICDVTYSYVHSYVWHDLIAFICVTWLIRICIHICDKNHSYMHSYVSHDVFVHAFIRVTRLIRICFHMCDITHSCTLSYEWHDLFVSAFICVTWLIRILQELWRCGTCGIYICSFLYDVTPSSGDRLTFLFSYVWVICVKTHIWMHIGTSQVMYEWVEYSHITCNLRMSRVTQMIMHSYLWLNSFVYLMWCDTKHSYVWLDATVYGVAAVSRIDKIVGLFCRILSLL